MKKKQKLFLASGLSLSLLVGIGAVMASKGATGLFGEDVYPSVKTNTITFTADDFANGATTITKNGNPFEVSGTVTVKGDVVTFAMGASLTRASTEGPASGMYKGAGLFYEMSVTGLDVDKPSQSVVHAGSNRTWYKVINDRGDGDGRGLYASAEEADKVGYHNISHTWSNNRDDNDPSAFWIETANPTLTASGGAFSFKTITYKYVCTRTDATYQRIMTNNKRGAYRFTDGDGNTLPAMARIGDTLTFKLEVDKYYAMQYDVVVKYSNFRESEKTKTVLTPNEDGVYSLQLSGTYVEADGSSGYTYLSVSSVEKEMTAIKDENDLKVISSDGLYYLANDIAVSNDEVNLVDSFNGLLDGKGHRIYAKKGLRDGWDAGQKGLLFNTFGGYIHSLELEFSTTFVNTSISGFAGTMTDGLIDDVTVRMVRSCFSYGSSGPFVGTMKGGLIRNSDVYFVSEDFDSTTDSGNTSGAILGDLEDGFVQNVTVHLPMPIDESKLKLVRSGADKLSGCRIVKNANKVYESPLKTPQTTDREYLGMPVTKMDVSNGMGGDLFGDLLSFDNGISSLSFYCKVEGYLKDGTNETTMPISSASTFTLPSEEGRDVWSYLEIRKIGEEHFISVCPFVNTSNAYSPSALTYMNEVKTFLPSSEVFGRLYSWRENSVATVYATPVYGE